MDSAQGDASKQPKETLAKATTEDDEHNLPILGNIPENEKETTSSSSTSSDDSSEEDFFQLDPIELNRALAGNNAQLVTEFNSQNGETTGISQSSKHGAVSLSENHLPMGRPFSHDVFGDSPGSDLNILGPRQSPPIQAMARTDVPDPNRIPSAIFARSKSSTPMEWSVASNESLFSIHVGNSSFSRDHVILLGRSGELGSTPPLSPLDRSGELGSLPPICPLGRTGELGNTPPISPLGRSGEVVNTRQISPLATSPCPASMDVGQGLTEPGVAAAANAEAMKDVLRTAAEGHADKGEPPAETAFLSASISRHSDGSTNSFSSFAFPILTGDGRSGSIKVEPEPQPRQPQPHQPPSETPKAAPAAAENKWFPCFSCCSFCC